MVVVTVIIGGAPAAHAHSAGGGLEASNYLTRLHRVAPQIRGVEFEVIEGGSRVQLTNRTDEEVRVPGYNGEPYLRIGPKGVFENRNSPATYINADGNQTRAPPADAFPDAEPRWRKVSSTPVARWHYHQAHWMLDQPPPEVRADPDRRRVISDWDLTFAVGDREVTATGDLLWIPGPSPAPWFGLAAGLGVVTVAIALSRAWAPGLAGIAAVLVASDVVHAVGVQWAGEQSTGMRVARLFGAGFFSVVGWVAGLLGTWLLARRKPDGLLLVAVSGLLVALFGGVVDLGDVSRSQIPFAFEPTLARATVAIALGLGGGAVVGAVLALRRVGPDDDGEGDESEEGDDV